MGNFTEDRFTIFNPVTGDHRLLFSEPSTEAAFSLDRMSSNGSYVVLQQWSRPIEVHGTPISIIRLADGRLLRDAFIIDPPFLCSDDWCFRD
jgi:hypothetical protein